MGNTAVSNIQDRETLRTEGGNRILTDQGKVAGSRVPTSSNIMELLHKISIKGQ